MALTREKEREFAEKLSTLCEKYGVLVKSETIRREAPTWPYVLVDFELTAKVQTSENPARLTQL